MAPRQNQRREESEKPLYDESAERAVIGICLRDIQVFFQAREHLRPNYFTNARLAKVFNALVLAADAGKPINKTYVGLYIKNDSGESTPLPVFLQVLINEAPPSSEGEIYIDTVAALAHKRQLLDAAQRGIHEILRMDISTPVEQMIDVMIREASSAVHAESDQQMRSYGEWGEQLYKSAEAAFKAASEGQEGAGLPAGTKAVEEVIGRLLPGKVYVLAGMSGGGKSAMARQINEGAAKFSAKNDLGEVVISSLEMPGEEYAARAMAERMGVPSWKLEQGEVNVSELDAMAEMTLNLRKMPITIDVRPRQTIKDIRTRWTRLKQRKGKLCLGTIDHMLLVEGSGRDQKLNDRVSEVTAEAKNLAKEMGIPVLLLAQLNEKQILERASGWPNFSDLFGGQVIKMNADVIFYVHRPEVVIKTREPNQSDEAKYAKWVERMNAMQNKAWVFADKRRGGESGSKREMIFHGPTMTFSDI